jgi:small subunit ribosomal protein S17
MPTETPTTAQPGTAPVRPERQELVGIVTSAKMEKTIVVKVARLVRHRIYQRVIKKTKKFYAHDEEREARVGDRVRIVSTRPLSKLKRWRLAEVIARKNRAA